MKFINSIHALIQQAFIEKPVWVHVPSAGKKFEVFVVFGFIWFHFGFWFSLAWFGFLGGKE